MKLSSREIMLYYDPKTSVGKKTRAYAHSLTKHIQDIEFHKNKFTRTIWKTLIMQLGIPPKQLLNKSHPYYQEHIKGRDFDDEGWINIIRNNPDLIKAPIVVKGSKAILISSPTDIYRLLKE
jgi:arsenate reductase (glutaredoxin)